MFSPIFSVCITNIDECLHRQQGDALSLTLEAIILLLQGGLFSLLLLAQSATSVIHVTFYMEGMHLKKK